MRTTKITTICAASTPASSSTTPPSLRTNSTGASSPTPTSPATSPTMYSAPCARTRNGMATRSRCGKWARHPRPSSAQSQTTKPPALSPPALPGSACMTPPGRPGSSAASSCRYRNFSTPAHDRAMSGIFATSGRISRLLILTSSVRPNIPAFLSIWTGRAGSIMRGGGTRRCIVWLRGCYWRRKSCIGLRMSGIAIRRFRIARRWAWGVGVNVRWARGGCRMFV